MMVGQAVMPSGWLYIAHYGTKERLAFLLAAIAFATWFGIWATCLITFFKWLGS
jgi:uncharacterized membrane protein